MRTTVDPPQPRFPVISVGRRITSEQVADALDDTRLATLAEGLARPRPTAW